MIRMARFRARPGRIAPTLFCLIAALHQPAAAEATCDPDTIWLRTAGGQMHRFSIELADDPAERAQGLMGREAMPKGAGMLFVYPAPTNAAFWMKNTLIPLDMLFFDGAGRLLKLHSMAKPLDLSRIDGGDGVVFVLEINGGLAEPLGLTPGTEMRHPAVLAKNAVWPCE